MSAPAERTAASRTRCVRAAIDSDPAHRAVVPPLYLSSNFAFPAFGTKGPYDYTRSGNPTRDALADALTDLEGGAGAVVTASGMAAVALVLQTLAPGSRVLAAHDCYGGTHRLLTALHRRGQLDVAFVDLTTESDPAALDAAFATEPPALVWVETPSNPLLRVTDIAAIVGRARAVGARVAVDNTFLSPALQRPLEWGADWVVHSTTKYLNGHSDVVGGAVVARDAADHEESAWWANCTGSTGAPFDSYLTLRGVRTLHARMRQHGFGAEAVLELLTAHPAVARVHHPSLSDHPGHEVAAAQQVGFGPMLSFELAGRSEAERRHRAGRLCTSLRLFTLAESLGGVESLVAHPATMTHAAMEPQARKRAGIGDGLVRLSVGIEDPADLVADLRAALESISGGRDRSAGRPVVPLERAVEPG